MTDGIDNLADLYAARYARLPVASADNQLEMVVQGVHTAQQYANLQRVLTKLDMVKRLDVLDVRGDAVHFVLELDGRLADVLRTLAANPTLVPAAQQGRVQHYQLVT